MVFKIGILQNIKWPQTVLLKSKETVLTFICNLYIYKLTCLLFPAYTERIFC